GGDQRRQPGAAARRHRRPAAGRAALPVLGGVRPRRGRAPLPAPGAGGGDARAGRQPPPGVAHTMTLRELVKSHRIVIASGSGGVGKPTVAASIALWGALNGRRAVALTIDPARRLASSLGLEALGSEEREIPATVFAAQGLRPRGSLAALMLDQKGAWD